MAGTTRTIPVTPADHDTDGAGRVGIFHHDHGGVRPSRDAEARAVGANFHDPTADAGSPQPLYSCDVQQRAACRDTA